MPKHLGCHHPAVSICQVARAVRVAGIPAPDHGQRRQRRETVAEALDPAALLIDTQQQARLLQAMQHLGQL